MAVAESRRPAPWRDSSAEIGVVVALVALLLAAALTQGFLLPMALVAGIGILGLAVAKPQAGLYLIVATLILGDTRLTDVNRGELKFMFESFRGTAITPLEILLLAAAAGVMLRITFDERVRARGGELLLPISCLLLAVGLGIGIGLSRGGDFGAIRGETRGFLYLPLAYLIVVHTVRTKHELSRFLWVFVILVNLMAFENVRRYFTHVRGGYRLEQAPDLAFAHEDAIFCAAAILILFSTVIWSKHPIKEWRALALLCLPMLALTVMKRRAGIVAMDAGLLLLCIILLRDNFRLFLMAVPVAMVGFALMLAVTWNEPGGTGQFARSFRTITGQETTIRDQASDEYRRVELQNVRLNIEDQPLTGLGFGREYTFYVPLADLNSFWELYPYVPHNTVMWVWMKAGIVGFVALLGLFASALMLSTQLTLALKPGPLKIGAFSFGAIALMFLIYSWADLGLISARALVLFGLALGGVVAVSYIAREETEQYGPGNATA